MNASVKCVNLGWQADNSWIIRGVSTEIADGQITAVVGTNGSGKTTLLHVLAGLRRASEGCVTLDSKELSSFSRKSLARRIALMEQTPAARVELSVRDVVALGRIPHEGRWGNQTNHPSVALAMQRTGVSELSERTWSTLSGGEKQRVQLARALAQEPEILLLDEPTNHLDLRHQLGLLEVVQSLDLTVVVVLHDLDLAAAFSHNMLVMDSGELVAAGPTEKVLTDNLIAQRFKVIGHVSRKERLRFSWDQLVVEDQ